MTLVESIGAGALLALFGFFGGCVHGKRASQSELLTTTAQLAAANGSVEACAASLDALSAQAQEDIAQAQEHAEATAKAVEGLAAENLHLSESLTDAETALVQAGQEPTCRDQLEMELCPAVPLL